MLMFEVSVKNPVTPEIYTNSYCHQDWTSIQDCLNYFIEHNVEPERILKIERTDIKVKSQLIIPLGEYSLKEFRDKSR